MDSKEIKACLKAAREAIRVKDFKEAAKQCKAVLVLDKNNYNALVFVGVAAEGMDQPDQALKAYKRAAEERPEQILAWQGLSNMLERNEDLLNNNETADIYHKLVTLNSSDPGKQLPYLHKLADLYVKVKDTEKACECLTQMLSIEKEGESRLKMLQLLITLLSPLAPKLSDEMLTLYGTSLGEVLDLSSHLSEQEINEYTWLLLLLTSQIDQFGLTEKCIELRQRFPSATPPQEFLLCSHLDQNIGEGFPSSEACAKIQELTINLLSMKPKSSLVKVGQAFTAIQDQKLVEARNFILGGGDDCISGHYYLSQVYLRLHSYIKCIDSCKRGLSACTSSNRILCAPGAHVMALFKLAQAEAYRGIGSLDDQDKALSILEEVQETIPTKAFLIKAYVKVDQGNSEEAEECMQYLSQETNSVKTLKALIHRAREEHRKALEILQKVTVNDPKDALATLKLGQVLWDLRESEGIDNVKQQCFTTLMKAAVLDPYNHETFLYLGWFYKEVQEDIVKARRCFQKAYDLSPGTEESGCALVDTLVELGEESQSLQILQTITSKAAAGCAKGAWLRLGLYQMKHEDPTTAIASLQSALRAGPNDNHVWECLAEAYLQRGSLTAALKAFSKAYELDSESLYCQYQIASIKHTLGELSEAIEEYKQILHKSSHYVPVLKGVGESLIQLARHNIRQCLDGRAQDCCEEAIEYLTRAASKRPDMSCLWKLMGDACTMVHCLASDCYSVPAKLIAKSGKDSDMKTVNKLQLFEIGARCYSQAVKLLPDSSTLWNDLSVCLYHQSNIHLKNGALRDGKALLQRASQAVKKALSLEPKDWRHWNVLGVIACSKADEKLALAQHCFIKSIEAESNNVVAWTNLGVLYLSRSEIRLAHDTFKAAQSVDPTFIGCWIGQALIAEIVGHEEAMDLFRHTTELGVHLESSLGYGQWVLSILGDAKKRDSELFQYSIQQMAAIPAASDALTRYTSRVKTDAVAYNMQGLLYEHQNLLDSASDALNKALKLVEIGGDVNSINNIKLNLARVLSKQKKYGDSIKLFELCDLTQDIEHACLYGLALYKSERIIESFKVYESVLEKAGSDEIRSQIYTALGMVAFKGKDMEGAKSQLFSGFQTSHPSPQGLQALCALGLRQHDMTLASAVLEELSKLEDKEKYLKSTTLLQIQKYLIKTDKKGAESHLRELIQAYPHQSDLWFHLSTFLLLVTREEGAAAAECVRSALNVQECGELSKEKFLETLGLLQAGHHKANDNGINALKSAQTAFHANPGSTSCLSSLACAVHAEAVVRQALHGTRDLLHVAKGLFSVLLSQENMSADLRQWTIQNLVLNGILDEDLHCTQPYLQELKEFEGSETFVTMMKKFLTVPEITQEVSFQGNGHLQLLVACAIYCHERKFTEAMNMLTEYLQSHENTISSSLSKSFWERIIYIAFCGLQEMPENNGLKESFDAVIKTAKEKEIASPIITLIKAMKAGEDKRLAKHLMATALDQVDTQTDLGYCSSLARKGLISLLWDSSKEADQKLVKALLDDARAKGDKAVLALFDELRAKK